MGPCEQGLIRSKCHWKTRDLRKAWDHDAAWDKEECTIGNERLRAQLTMEETRREYIMWGIMKGK
jgi:hypothetical protein